MTAMSILMARKRPFTAGEAAQGPILAANLCRLGYCEQVVKTTEIAQAVEKSTGKSMSRQRISNLMNAAYIKDETVEMIAKALGVKPEDLRRPIG